MIAVHPGEILREEYMAPLDLSINELALELGIPVPHLLNIVLERRGVTTDTALRLVKYFGTDMELWANLQARYETTARNTRYFPDKTRAAKHL